MTDRQTSPVGEDAELLPCPFCGGAVELERAADTRSEMYGVRQWWGVKCRNTINLGGTCAIEQVPSASKEAAVARWNRRAAPTQPKAQVGSIDDYAQFHILHGAWMSAREYWQDDAAEQVAEAWRKLIDYIDAWAGSRAGDAAQAEKGST